jgi:hypothetical protein
MLNFNNVCNLATKKIQWLDKCSIVWMSMDPSDAFYKKQKKKSVRSISQIAHNDNYIENYAIHRVKYQNGSFMNKSLMNVDKYTYNMHNFVQILYSLDNNSNDVYQ